MRKFLLITAALALCATAALAGPAQKDTKAAPSAAATAAPPTGKTMPPGGHGSGMHKVLNNVVRVGANGERTALCTCGMEFKVTDKSPVWERNGTTFFMCSDACKEATAKQSPEDLGKTMSAWREKFHGEKLATNAVEKDGKRMAVCACGRSFEVTDQNPVIIENGVRLSCCSEACHEHLMKMPATERAAAEAKVSHGAAKS